MTDQKSICRLLPLQARDGALNMAIDEALLLSAEAGRSAPTLRLYAWSRPTLSLGYFQDAPAADAAFRHLPTVRRLTGGGAIVHAAEVTYSLTWRLDGQAHGIPGGVGASYAHFNWALCTALKELGLRAQPPADAVGPGRYGLSGPRPAVKSPKAFLCFERCSRYDLVVDGQKIVGSAQRRRRGAALLHGSILVGPSAARGAVLPSVSELVGRVVPLEEMAGAVVRGFEEALGWRFEVGHLSIDEGHLAEGLRHHVYSHLAWGGRRRTRAITRHQ